MAGRVVTGIGQALRRRARRGWVRVRSGYAARADARATTHGGRRAVHLDGRRFTARLVHRFDSHAATAEALRQVRVVLDAAGARHVVLPRAVEGRPVVAVDGAAAAALGAALRALARRREWVVELGTGWRAWRRPLSAWAHLADPPERFVLFPVLVGPAGGVLGSSREGVVVETWRVVTDTTTPRADGGAHLPGTRVAPARNTSFAYLTRPAWDAARRDDGPPALPHLLDVTEPVDVVYTWVDGGDPEWLEREEEALRRVDPSTVNITALASSRFVTRDELRYSLRSLEMYAGWVRRVHVVTDRQVPRWLDLRHPKLHVVDHREIFTDPSVLPVFNSHAIESQLHHVPGLADRYLYLNDDVFFGRPVRPELFFEANGLTRFFLSDMQLDVGTPSTRDLPVLAAAKNNRALIAELFGRTVTQKFQHTPHPQNREVLEELEERFPDLFKTLAASTFRHPDDLSVAAALHHYYAYATRRAVPGRIRYAYRDIAALRSSGDLRSLTEEPRYDVFCLNDTYLVPGPEAVRCAALLRRFLSAAYPVPSSFEKEGGAPWAT